MFQAQCSMGCGGRGAGDMPGRFAGLGSALNTSARGRDQRGFTFVELLVVTPTMVILAAAVMPLARVTVQRQREAELRRALREMRTAIDKFKDAADMGVGGATETKGGGKGYPPALKPSVKGVPRPTTPPASSSGSCAAFPW